MKVSVTQWCPSLCHHMDFSPPGSSVHGILQARILEWVAISFSRGSSQPRDQTQVTHIVKDYLLTEPPGKPWRSLPPWRKRQTRGRKREAELGTPFSVSPLRYSLWLSCSQGLLLFLLQHPQINSKWIKDLNVKNKTLKLLGNIWDSLIASWQEIIFFNTK